MKADNIGIRILVDDFRKMFEFYHNVLGFEVNGEEDGNGVYVNFKTKNNTYISMFKKQNNLLYDGYTDIGKQIKSDYVTICINAEEPYDVDILYAELKEKGIETIGAPRNMLEWGFRCLWFRDPEGNMLEFGGPLKKLL